jgi:hypothetical protein
MGIRAVERRLAAELCYEAVAEAVHEYLEESRHVGRLLWPHEHLVVPIIRAGYHPPGLLGVDDFIFRHQMISRAERKHAVAEARELSLPDEGELIEWIMWPYPTARLRARQRREETRLLVLRQARESRREDATKCKTMQRKTAEDQTPTDEGAIADLAVRHDPESPRENATKCNTLQQNAATSDPAVKSAVTRRERALPPDVSRGLEEMGKRMHFESLGDHKYSVTIDPPAESAAGKGRRSRADEQTYRKAGTSPILVSDCVMLDS